MMPDGGGPFRRAGRVWRAANGAGARGREALMSHLPPAYRGAPYYQPRPMTRRQRARRTLAVAAILAGVLLLLILIGASIAPGSLLP